ncbi:MAG TPA: hypothetical protein DEA08_30680 [Planctomycetes bacterium]|nr:hypothetical protein [Planctomycetota bacterium]
MSHATSPSGLVTRFTYRDPTTDPDPGDPDNRLRGPSLIESREGSGPAVWTIDHQRSSSPVGFVVTVSDSLGRSAIHSTPARAAINKGRYTSSWTTVAGDWSRKVDLFSDRQSVARRIPFNNFSFASTYRFFDEGRTHIRVLGFEEGGSRAHLALDGFWTTQVEPLQGPTQNYAIETKQGGKVEGLIRNVSWEVAPGSLATVGITRNEDGEVEEVMNPVGVTTTTERYLSANKQGLPSAQIVAPGGTTYLPLGATPLREEFDYDLMGNVTSHRDTAGLATITAYTALDQIREVRLPSGLVQTNVYDQAGRLQSTSTNQGGRVTYVYNEFDQVIRVDQEGVGSTHYQRDEMGHLTQVTTPRGEEVRYEYDNRWLVSATEHHAAEEVAGPLELQRRITYQRIARGNVLHETRTEGSAGANSYTTSYGYTAVGLVRSVVRPPMTLGESFRPQTTYHRGSNWLVNRVEQDVREDREDKLASYVRDDADRVIAVRNGTAEATNPHRSQSEVLLDLAGNPNTFLSGDFLYDPSAPVGGTVLSDRPRSTVTRDGLARVKEVRNGSGCVIAELTYDSAGRVVVERRPNSNEQLEVVSRNVYDPLTGRLQSSEGYDYPGAGKAKREYYYDAEGRVKKTFVRDGGGNLITVNEVWYDAIGRVVRRQSRDKDTNPTEQRESRYEFHPQTGDVTRETQVVNGNSYTWVYTYGVGGRLETTTDPLGKVSRLVYDAEGRLQKRIKKDGVEITYEYDGWDRVKTVTGPTETITYEYDARNRVISEANALVKREFSYEDDLGRLESVKVTFLQVGLQVPKTFTYRYNAAEHRYGGLTEFVDPNGLETKYSYNRELDVERIEQRQGSAGPFSEVGSFAYDCSQRMTEWRTRGGSWERDYDATGRVLRQHGAQPNHSISYSHDAFGRRKTATYAHLQGLKFAWAYDGIGRMFDEQISYGDGAPAYRETLTFDEAGNRSSRILNGQTTLYDYNEFNQLVRSRERVRTVANLTLSATTGPPASPGTDVLGPSYAPGLAVDGTIPTTSGANQAFVSGTADVEHLLEVSVTSGAVDLTGLEVHLPTDRNLPDKLHLEYFDGSAWVPLPVQSATGADVVMSGSDQDGLRARGARVFASVWPPINTSQVRVRQAQGEGPAQPTTHDNALAVNEVRLFTASSEVEVETSYVYDDNGNMKGVTRGAYERTYEYDQNDRLISIDDVGGAVPVNMRMAYCPSGKLTRQEVSGSVEHLLYQGDELYARYDASDALTKRYILGPGLDRKIGVVPYSGGVAENTRYFFPTPNGSVHQVTEWDPLRNGGLGAAVLANTELTSAWGVPILQDRIPELLAGGGPPVVSIFAPDFGYTGRRKLGNSGLMDYRNRIYDPLLGRFLTSDPIGTKAGLNTYAYVNGDPVNLTDPFGLDPYDVHPRPEEWYNQPGLYNKFQALRGEIGALWNRHVNPWGDAGAEVLEETLDEGEKLPGAMRTLGEAMQADPGGTTRIMLSQLPGVARNMVMQPIDQTAEAHYYHLLGDAVGERKAVIKSTTGFMALFGVAQGTRSLALRTTGVLRAIREVCFVAGTLVVTQEGRVPIEDVSVGDLVLSRDPETGEIGFKRVTRLFSGKTTEIAEVRLFAPDLTDDSASVVVLTCTPTHLFRTRGRGWVEAKSLKPGDQLVTETGSLAVVAESPSIRQVEALSRFNLEVEDWHCYFVAPNESSASILVHNDCWDLINYYRRVHPNLPDLPSPDYVPGSQKIIPGSGVADKTLGTVAFVKIGERVFFGVNPTAMSDAMKNLHRLFFDTVLKPGGYSGTRSARTGKALTAGQYGGMANLFHAEATALLRAWKHNAIPKGGVLRMVVDRHTCRLCMKPLGEIVHALGLKGLEIVQKNGKVVRIKPIAPGQ